MDKKNTIIGILLIGAAMYLMTQDGMKRAEQAEAQQAAQQQVEAMPDPANGKPSAKPANKGDGLFADEATETPEAPADPESLISEASDLPEQTYELANDYIRVTFTSKGGGIKQVAFIDHMVDGRLKYPATLNGEEPYLFNAGAEKPALALSWQEDDDGLPDEFTGDFTVTQLDPAKGAIQFTYQHPSGKNIVRNYLLSMATPQQAEVAEEDAVDPYVIQHDTHFINKGQASWPLEAMFINVGTAPPTLGDVRHEFLNFGYYAAGDAEFLRMSKFTGSKGFLGFGASSPNASIELGLVDETTGQPIAVWASIKNQFFASVLTPTDTLGSGVFAKPVDLSATMEDPELQKGMTGAMKFDLGSVPVGEKKSILTTFYVGPKEYFRLNTLGADQDEIMQFGFFGGISKILLYALVSIHDVIVHFAPTWGWGFAIIILTCIIKGLLWPLTQVQVRSAKAMQKIQGPMKELQEKYKDNPTKLQQETMKLFKEHKVNPAAGCLPILLQIPIFFGLYVMLRTSSDLRFSPFLWIEDLSVPDTIPGLPAWFHLLPLLMTGAMVIQMRMTPTPTTDNMQRKIFQFMPVIFLVFCYKFPSGLVLYWTVQNCISIFQQWLTNRKRDDEPAAAGKDAKTDDGVIDVTENKAKKAPQSNGKKGGKKRR